MHTVVRSRPKLQNLGSHLKFNLLELAALPLIFLLLSAIVAPCVLESRYSLVPRARRDIGELKQLSVVANGERFALSHLDTAEEFNTMIDDPASEFEKYFAHELRKDTWGNPYVCVESELEDRCRWTFYSKGADRTSHNNGDDPDDLNSWDLSYEYYIRFESFRERRDVYEPAALFTLPVFVVLLYFKRWFERGRKTALNK